LRVVLDTNVIVAALATRGACAELFARVLAVHEYGLDANLQAEVERVLRVELKLPDERIAAARELLASTGVAVDSVPLAIAACRDPDDDRILALALAFHAEVLVTGDEDLFVLHPWSGISIVRPRDFWPIDRAAGVSGQGARNVAS
jgi:putative PIN family toxin of toxin-antitoxin system